MKIFKVNEEYGLENLHCLEGVIAPFVPLQKQGGAEVNKTPASDNLDTSRTTRTYRKEKHVGGRTLFAKRYHDAINAKTDEIQNFLSLYEIFVRRHCAPNMGLADGCGEVLLFQR